VTPLRKIGLGLFVTASSFIVIASIESRIQHGHVVSVWWQMLAYAILTCGEVLASITALEFSYKQAPLSMKSSIMALFYLSISAGNLSTAAVNHYMVRPPDASAIETDSETWVQLPDASRFVEGQTIADLDRVRIAGGEAPPVQSFSRRRLAPRRPACGVARRPTPGQTASPPATAPAG
jgi:proton-dependent oligopeptide transporter, POT family